MTTKFVEDEVTPAAVAVITSVLAQPLSVYEPVATPPTVNAPLSTARPTLPQGEEKVTALKLSMGTPPIDTATVILVVPNAESGALPTPRTGAVTVTAVLPTVNPIESVTATVPTWALAVTVVAPAVKFLAGLSVTVATPDASVRAVVAGLMVATPGSVLKVTIAFGTTAPAAFFKVAFSVAGAPLEMELTVVPAELVSANVKLGAAMVVVVTLATVVTVVPVVVPPVVATSGPLPQPVRTARVDAKKSDAERLEIFGLRKLRAKKKKLCTQALLLCAANQGSATDVRQKNNFARITYAEPLIRSVRLRTKTRLPGLDTAGAG